MNEELETTIRKLNSKELRAVVSAFPEVARDRLKKVYVDDPSAWAALQSINETQATLFLKDLMPEMVDIQKLTDESLRQFLLGLVEYKEYEPYLRAALERRLLVSIDPVIMGTLLVLALSVKWKFKIKKAKNGKTEFEFEASKSATPREFLKKLLGWISIP
jgi:hypothetical protein